MLALPVRARGRQTAAGTAAYLDALRQWCEALTDLNDTLDFRVSSRGWCYILEEHGLSKGDFDKAQTLINDCRKRGWLPIDFCAEDTAREFDGLEHLDAGSPDEEAEDWIATLRTAHRQYTPISFWHDQPVYLQVLVEKIDLKTLFAPICRDYRIPIANARGWSDINTRAALMRRFRDAERRGQQVVLLYCGDHDPAGLLITDTIKSNLQEISGAVGWSPDRLIVDRFGLNRDFIDRHTLSWIDGLETGSGGNLSDPRHGDHRKPYVQSYLRAHGARKVEANALVTRPEAGRQLLLDTIGRYLPLDAPRRYQASLGAQREALRVAIASKLQESWS